MGWRSSHKKILWWTKYLQHRGAIRLSSRPSWWWCRGWRSLWAWPRPTLLSWEPSWTPADWVKHQEEKNNSVIWDDYYKQYLRGLFGLTGIIVAPSVYHLGYTMILTGRNCRRRLTARWGWWWPRWTPSPCGRGCSRRSAGRDPLCRRLPPSCRSRPPWCCLHPRPERKAGMGGSTVYPASECEMWSIQLYDKRIQ